jgi:hypothetical protein
MRAAIFLAILMCLNSVDAQKNKVHLEKISTLFIPSRYDSNDFPEFKLGRHAAEQLAYDPTQKIIYVTGIVATSMLYPFILMNYIVCHRGNVC